MSNLYFSGTVKQQIEEGSYYIQDSVGNLEAIFREDIISDKDDANTLIKVSYISCLTFYYFVYFHRILKSSPAHYLSFLYVHNCLHLSLNQSTPPPPLLLPSRRNTLCLITIGNVIKEISINDNTGTIHPTCTIQSFLAVS